MAFKFILFSFSVISTHSGSELETCSLSGVAPVPCNHHFREMTDHSWRWGLATTSQHRKSTRSTPSLFLALLDRVSWWPCHLPCCSPCLRMPTPGEQELADFTLWTPWGEHKPWQRVSTISIGISIKNLATCFYMNNLYQTQYVCSLYPGQLSCAFQWHHWSVSLREELAWDSKPSFPGLRAFSGCQLRGCHSPGPTNPAWLSLSSLSFLLFYPLRVMTGQEK